MSKHPKRLRIQNIGEEPLAASAMRAVNTCQTNQSCPALGHCNPKTVLAGPRTIGQAPFIGWLSGHPSLNTGPSSHYPIRSEGRLHREI
jgi:hypothetical protein